MVQLERLTIGFHSPASRPPPSMTRPPSRRATLPSLRFFDFHGATEYLEEFVARIDLNALCKVSLRLFNDIFFDIPHISQFISRINALGSPTGVYVTLSVEFVSVVFFSDRGQSNENCFLGTSCRRLDWQLSFATEISSQFSALLSSVHELIIQAPKMPTGEGDSTQWLEFFQSFTHVTEVTVWDEKLVPGIVQALVMEDVAAGVLPELTRLYLEDGRSPSTVKAAEQFVATRRLSGCTVYLSG